MENQGSKKSMISKHDWVVLPLLLLVGLGVCVAIWFPFFFVSDFTSYHPSSLWFSSTLSALVFLLLAVFTFIYILWIFRRRPINWTARGIAYFFACLALGAMALVLSGWAQSCPTLGGGEESCSIWIIFLLALAFFNSGSSGLMAIALIVGIIFLFKRPGQAT